MSRTDNGATTTSSTQQFSIEKESSFIPFALLVFIGLAGIAAWLGQPMLCDLCIAEVFFISNRVVTNGASRLAFKSQVIEEPELVEVNLEEKEAKTEESAIVEEGQDHSAKAAIPEISLPTVKSAIIEEPVDEPVAIEVITVDLGKKEEEQPEDEEEEVAEVSKVLITEPVDISNVLSSVPEITLPTKEEVVVTPEVLIVPDTSEAISSNTISEHIEYINKRPRRVSFATPPTPPVSPPREPFAIPAGLRLPPVPVPASILTPPLSPQIPPLDFFIGIDEEVIKKGRDDIRTLQIDEDWDNFATDLVKSDSFEHSLDSEFDNKVEQVDSATEKKIDITAITEKDLDDKVEQVDSDFEEQADRREGERVGSEREKKLRDQILEAFEEDMPVVAHVEDVSTEISKGDVQSTKGMDSSMVILTTQDASPETSVPSSTEFSPRTEIDEPTTISLSQQKPTLIILTPEAEESRIIYDANNSRLSSFDAQAAFTEPESVEEKIEAVTAPVIPEEEKVDIIAAPIISEEKVDIIAARTIVTQTNKSNIVFSDPFISILSETTEEQKVTEKSLEDSVAPSPTTTIPEIGPEVIRGPYIEVDEEEDEPSIPPVATIVEKEPSIPPVATIVEKETTDDVAEVLQEEIPAKDVKAIGSDVPEAPQVVPEAPKETVAIASTCEEVTGIVDVPKVEEVDTSAPQSKVLPTLLVTTPMIPEDEELVIPERKPEVISRPPSPISKVSSRPSTGKTSTSSASETTAASSTSIDYSRSTSPVQRSSSAPGSVVRTANSFGDSTLFSSSMTNANTPTTPAATQTVDQKEILPKGKEIKRLTKIEEELDGLVDVVADVETNNVLIEKDNHFASEDQYTEKKEQHANDTKSPRTKTKISQRAIEKSPEIKPVAVIESAPKRPFPTPLYIKTPPRVYNPVPEIESLQSIPRIPSLTQKQGGRKVHFDIDDMVAPNSPMFILPIPPSVYGDRPGSRDSSFLRPASRDSAFSSLSCLDRSPDIINFPNMPRFPSQAIAARMEPTLVLRDPMPVRSGMNDKSRLSLEVMKYSHAATSEWNSIDLERGTFLGASPKPSYDFGRDRDFSEWVDITRDEEITELRAEEGTGALLPLHNSPAGEADAPRKRWTLLRALSIPFSAFRASTDTPRSPVTPTTPTSATLLHSPESSTFGASPRETTGFFSQFYPLSPSTPTTPATPKSPSALLLSPTSPMSPIDPLEPIIPKPESQPLPIRFLKKLSPKGLLTGATGAARKAWGLVKYLTGPTTPTPAPVSAASRVVERKRSMNWARWDDLESTGVKMEAGRSGNHEGVLIDFGEDEEDRRRRAREAGKRIALEGIEELREVVVVPIPRVMA